MAFSLLQFSKNWTNAEDFPTYESDETKVRADMQLLFDEIRTAFNKLVGQEMVADNVQFSHETLTSHDVAGALSEIYQAVLDIAQDERFLPDGSVTTAKLANTAVTTAKLAAGAVGADQIAAGAVTAAKLASGAVTASAFADSAITTTKLADGAVTKDKISSYAVTTEKINGGAVTTAKIADANVTTGKLADDAVTTAKIANSNVTTAKIADANVTTAKIADANVTTAKIADGAVTLAKTTGLQPMHKTATVTLEGGASSWADLSVPGVKGDGSNVVICDAAPAYKDTWTNYGIRALDPTTDDKLSFSALASTPADADVVVNILILD